MFPFSDVINPAFLQNAMAMGKLCGRTKCLNQPEAEMAGRIGGGHRLVTKMHRNICDCQRAEPCELCPASSPESKSPSLP